MAWRPTPTPHTRPDGALPLARRILDVDLDAEDADVAARALCRLDPFPTVTGLIGEYFEGTLSGVLFDCIADAFDFVQAEREAAAA